jgi:hypothetical protein
MSRKPLPATVEATEAELAQLNAECETAMGAQWNYGNQRTKAFGRRTDAHIRRAAARSARISELETHLACLRRAAAAPPPKPPPTEEEIRAARLVRDQHGWSKVVKVNRTTVTIEVPPGWNDKIPFRKIIEVRE